MDLAIGILCLWLGSACLYLGTHGLTSDTFAETNNGRNVKFWNLYTQLFKGLSAGKLADGAPQ
jgi:hypothetical protein